MSNLLDNYRDRRSFLDNITYDEAKTRLIGFYDWLLSEPEIMKMIDGLNKSVDLDKIIEGCDYSHGPKVSTPDEITTLGFFFLDKIKSGIEAYNLSDQYGIHSIYDSGNLQSDFEELMDKYIDPAFDFIERKMEEIQDKENTNNIASTAPHQSNAIFIVHGHDEGFKREVQLLISRTGLDDVVLHEKPDKGRTLIDKLIEEGQGAAYVIALLSPDDKLLDGTPRARQNVILEIGYFLGMLGKSKVRLLKKGDIEIPSDLQGILYTEFDNTGAWKMKLLKEMKSVGIQIDLDRVLEKL